MPASYCKEHQTMFFKKGKMKGYAHPIQDDEGENTGEWCNEEEKQEEKKESPAVESTDRQTSIEAQNAYSGVIQLIIHDKIKPDGSLALTALAYAASKLSQWSQTSKPITSTGKPSGDKEGEEVPELINVGALLNWCAERGLNRNEVVEILEIKGTPHQITDAIANINISDAYQVIKEHLEK